MCQSEDRFILILLKTKHPIHIKEFREVTKDSDVMHPFIFLRGLRFNTET